MSEFRKELEEVINSHSKDNGSDTPDFILAEYLTQCLAAFDSAVMMRERWYGRFPPKEPQPRDVPSRRAGPRPLPLNPEWLK